MTDTPEDIRAKAGGVPSDILKAAMKIMSSSLVKFDGGIEGGAVVRCIVDGILLERERCAQIAMSMTGVFNNAEDIAEAIRTPTP